MRKKFEFNKRYVTDTLRNCGYTNYSAISDILDNSLEIDVDAKNVNIKVDHDKGNMTVSRISIIDDGSGMSQDTLEQAMRLGSNTDKDTSCLGMYGAGMKLAAISMGQKLTVITKTAESDVLITATLDISDDESSDDFEVEYQEYGLDTDLYSEFKDEVGCDKGTIVRIEKIDLLSGKSNYAQFCETLKKNIRPIFSKFIESGEVTIRLNGKKLKPFDVIGNKHYGSDAVKLRSGNIDIDGIHAEYIAWHIKHWAISDFDDDDYYPFNQNHQGIYIYRQNRLVGNALSLGLFNRHNDYNGFRMELFLDGKSDSVFNTSYTKMIAEKNKSAIDKKWADELGGIINECISSIRAEVKAKRIKDSENDPVTDDILENVDKVVKKMNSNMWLKKGMPTNGRNKKRDEEDIPKSEHKSEHKKQQNPNPHKVRTEEWISGWKFEHDGETGLFYRSEMIDNKNYIIINQDHVYYKTYFSKLDDELQRIEVMRISMSIQAKKRSNYDTDEYTKSVIDDYETTISLQLRHCLEGYID